MNIKISNEVLVYKNLLDFINPYGIIYIIINNINNKKYIGQTIRKLNERCCWTKSSILCRYINSLYLINSIKKYGFENFERKILDFAQSQEELDAKEEYYILKYNTLDQNYGYNLKHGGSHGKHIQETKDRLSKKLKGKTYEELYGIKKAEEIKKKISESNTGNKPWNKGKNHSKESKEKMSESQKKRWKDLEKRNKQSEKHIKYYFTREYLMQEYWITEHNMGNRILDIKQKSMKEIAEKNNGSEGMILKRLTKYNIIKRNTSETNKLRYMKRTVVL